MVGLGPKFIIKLHLQNGGAKPVSDLTITFSYNSELYNLPSPVFSVPLLLPVRVCCAHRDVCVAGLGFCWCMPRPHSVGLTGFSRTSPSKP